MSTATPGNINATDILRGHEARIVARPWRVEDDGCVFRIYGPPDAGGWPRILMTLVDAGREEADFIADLRNVLPEMIRGADNACFRIRYLERELARRQAVTLDATWVPF